MIKHLVSYGLLSCLSFLFFITLFHTVVNAQTIEIQTPQPSTEIDQPNPTPTVFVQQNPTTAPFFGQTYPTPIKSEPTPTRIVTPSPTPTPLPTAVVSSSGGDLEALFTRFSDEYHVDRSLLRKIAVCESGLRSNASNGIYLGMYQFAAQTWITARSGMGLDTNPDLRMNPEEAIRTAAFMLQQGRQNAWANCL